MKSSLIDRDEEGLVLEKQLVGVMSIHSLSNVKSPTLTVSDAVLVLPRSWS
ncbi:hypothetical protein AM1_4105 [Acaryochloris marina MBIC11017]|uniref:Uncharacterized protein n=1 Tax=Acaryochloris marina (strain MBIC 11017) TaxID=329726 RepID=B0CAM0_ACAM1|nr:hypothetical protein AM1_4105 [Acaryochloris marina MBIC11017]